MLTAYDTPCSEQRPARLSNDPTMECEYRDPSMRRETPLSCHSLKAAPGPTSRYFITRLQSGVWWIWTTLDLGWHMASLFFCLLGMGEIIEASALKQWETFGLQKDTFFLNKYDVIRNPHRWGGGGSELGSMCLGELGRVEGTHASQASLEI